MRAFVAAALATVAGLAANAQEPGLPPDLAAIIRDPQHKQATLGIARRSVQNSEPGCHDAQMSVHQVTVLKPLQISGGKPVAGAWIERLRAVGCGQERTFNVLSVVRAGGEIYEATLLPGTTWADPLLQRDAVRYAAAAAGPAPAGCDQSSIVDTRFIGAEGPRDPSFPDRLPPWREEWTLAACGKRSTVTMHFIPDATGTTITTRPGETRQE